MALAPCSMATVAAVSQGLADNLIRRAADVTIKERRPLVVIPRESPLSIIHLENLTRLATLGATIIPPEPAFYLRQQTIEDVAKYAAQRDSACAGRHIGTAGWDAIRGGLRYSFAARAVTMIPPSGMDGAIASKLRSAYKFHL